MRRRTIVSLAAPLLLGVALPIAAAPPASAAQPYVIVDIGSLAGATGQSFASAINAAGDVIGASDVAGGHQHAVLFKNGALSDLGTLPGGTDSLAVAVNASDVGVGATPTSAPLEFSGGQVTDLTPTGSAGGAATAINDGGTIVGFEQLAAGGQQAVAFTGGGAATPLGSLGGPTSRATGISSGGVAVGQADDTHGSTHAVSFSRGAAHDLGTLPNPPSPSNDAATAISPNGTFIVGTSADGPHRAATQYAPGPPAQLTAPSALDESQAFGVNDAGVAVGEFDGAAAMFSGGTTTILSTLLPSGSGWTPILATGINNAGQIVGIGTHNGVVRGFVMTPPAPIDPCAPATGTLTGALNAIPVIGPPLAALICRLVRQLTQTLLGL